MAGTTYRIDFDDYQRVPATNFIISLVQDISNFNRYDYDIHPYMESIVSKKKKKMYKSYSTLSTDLRSGNGYDIKVKSHGDKVARLKFLLHPGIFVG